MAGLSLRKVKKFLELTKKQIITTDFEDMYFSKHITNKPLCNIAKNFSQETKAILDDNNLPFGCHGCYRHNNPNFCFSQIFKYAKLLQRKK